ncbi:protein of unknown function [Ralstonia solanacearum PSI07]|nr:protein of unknown function [Ralstonia solanacearum PSI07]
MFRYNAYTRMTPVPRSGAYNVRMASLEGPKDANHENRGFGLVGRDARGMCGVSGTGGRGA